MKNTSKLKVEDIWPLSPLQEGLLFHASYDTSAADDVYVGLRVLGLEGHVRPDQLRASWQALLDRHACLRAAFRHRAAGEAVQIIPEYVEVPWSYRDLSMLPEADAEAEADRLAAETGRRFDLAVPPMVRVLLLRFGPGRYQMVAAMHHILTDGWSLPILFNDLWEIYGNGGDPSALPPPAQYRDYLAWLVRQDKEAARAAWRDALAGTSEPTLIAPEDWHSEPSAAPEGVASHLSEDLAGQLREVARSSGATLNRVFQGAWALLLSKIAGRGDVVFGSTVSGRPAEVPDVERMVGLFINTVPVRARLSPGKPFADLVAELQAQESELLDHQHLSLADIQRAGGPGATFDTLLVFQNLPPDTLTAPAEGPQRDSPDDAEGDEQPGTVPRYDGVQVTSWGGETAAHYPLTLIVTPQRGMEVQLDYRPGVFSEATARVLADRLLRVLRQIAADPRVPLGEIEILDESERRQLDMWNGTSRPLPEESLAALFERRAVAQPESVAVVSGDQELSYAELNERASRLAHRLIGWGAGPETRVGIVMERSAALITALLAVVKAGAAYVPLDVGYPPERIRGCLDGAGVHLVLLDEVAVGRGLSSPDIIGAGRALPVIEAELNDGSLVNDPVVSVRPDSLAYIMYTSGSTGQPKGVAVTQANVIGFCLDRCWPEGVADSVLVQANHAFDASTYEIWVPLLRGGRLVLVPAG